MGEPDLPLMLQLFTDPTETGSASMAAMLRGVVTVGHELHRDPLNGRDEDGMGQALDALEDLVSDLDAAAEEALERHDNPDTFGDRADYLHEQGIADAMLGGDEA